MSSTQFDHTSERSTKFETIYDNDSSNRLSTDHCSTEVEILTLDQAYDRLGGFSYFQFWATPLFIWGFTNGGCLITAFSMLEKPPKYLCFNEVGTTYECQADQSFCIDPSIKYKIDWDDPTSLYNWVESLDLTCESASRIGMIGSMFFIGKNIYLLSMGLQTFFYAAILMSQSLNITLVLICGFGLVSFVRTSIGFIFMQEMTPDKYKTFIGSFALVSLAIVPAILALYHIYISKDWLPFQTLSAFTTLLVTISIFALPESPQYLISKKQYDDARKSLETIAWWNSYKGQLDFKFKDEVETLQQSDEETYLLLGIPDQDLNQYKSTNEQNEILENISINSDTISSNGQDRIILKDKNQTKFSSVKEILKQKQHACNLFIMMTVWIAASFDFQLLTFQIKYIKGDFFTNILVAALTEAIACIRFYHWWIDADSILRKILGLFDTIFHFTCQIWNKCSVQSTIFSPMVAEATAPIPMIFYCLFALVPCILSNFLILDGIEEKSLNYQNHKKQGETLIKKS
ncbi:solute carrier family member 5 [Stylonychia lemnae]|uniref:Solute carrier family member 5 n=1 Tax=Stylonychia lemnae TaxID=5949 RepID=A0A078AUP8_STYLE|nr:solute carrier family member 5 [Stylonychia lemnae]|eukprot:CDW84608.1 solute carrier family member 5 [Stylonychia lemnae]